MDSAQDEALSILKKLKVCSGFFFFFFFFFFCQFIRNTNLIKYGKTLKLDHDKDQLKFCFLLYVVDAYTYLEISTTFWNLILK